MTKVEDLTGFPECLEGRVKTLHPRVHAGILADTRKPDHVAQLADLGVEAFELVVVNLYPFAATVASGASPDECVEQIDIGGPSMVRAAAKNHPSVAVVTDPSTYGAVLDAVRGGGFTLAQRKRLAAQAFVHTATYDVHVASWMGNAYTDTLRRHRLPGLGRRDLGAGRRCCATARTRTSAPPSTPTASSRSPASPRPTPAARQGDVLQQLRRRGCRRARRLRPRRPADRRRHQARQPLRHRGRRRHRRGPPQGARVRPGLGLRRHHRDQPPGHRRDGRAPWPTSSPRSSSRPAFDADALEVLTREEEHPPARVRRPGARGRRDAPDQRRPAHAAARRRRRRGARRRRRGHRWRRRRELAPRVRRRPPTRRPWPTSSSPGARCAP